MRRLALPALLLAAALDGCAPATPPPSCRTAATDEGLGRPPYLARLSRRETSGACAGATLPSVMRLGVQDFVPPGTGPATLALRPERLVDLVQGRVFLADVDRRNDCQAALEGDPRPRCEACSPDGGNACVLVPDPVPRRDPSGLRLDAVGPFAREPVAGRCLAPEPLVVEQQLAPEPLTLVDGGSATLPAYQARFAFSDVSVITTPEVPGTAFTATLTHTEGPCTVVSDVLAFFPAVACTVDAQCATALDPDAGVRRLSGINPAFKPVCDPAAGFCVPTVDVTRPGLPPLP
ncbi:MAG: hypothetical protein INH41_19920 [Myxococcaceae bacterium]|jgi:hypothetical protein|nr:hypothetical protein [Myxococcaceae bacterium]MCA3014656.1 hypothetical protein [Myxococcaceae bacterium]